MARPRKVPLDIPVQIPTDEPVKASESLVEAFFLKDPTSAGGKRIIRVHSAAERDRFIQRGWVLHG